MLHSYRSMRQKLRAFWLEEAAATIVVFAMALPMVLGAAGLAVDLAQAYNVRTRLANALDKAALAAGSMNGSEAEIKENAMKFFEANFPDAKLGVPYDVEAEVNDGYVTFSATARVNTTFMAALGYDYIDVREESEVLREFAGVEVALVLDVTGSMAGNNITALKTASTNFLNIMFDRIEDPAYIKIGIVPFSQSVNVGPYGLGKDTSNANYGTAFVSKPTTDDYVSPASNIAYSSSTSTSVTTNWKGCILERSGGLDLTDDVSPKWGMYRYPRICSKSKNGVCQSYSNNDANNGCTNSRIVPLTNNQTRLQSTINALNPAGNTFGNVGMAWGWRVISPTEPFTEGTAYDHPDWSKTVIMMTDGDNTMNSVYSAFGKTANHSIDADDLDDKYAEICENMKAEGINIYTITFQSDITNATREIFRTCATSPAQYYNAPSNASLVEAFEDIANQLSQLHIVK